MNWEGNEEGAEISPDGQFVAFLADRSGKFDIWETRVGTGVFSNLTSSMPPLASSGFIVRKLGFSADGKDLSSRTITGGHVSFSDPAAVSSTRCYYRAVVK